MTDAGIGGQDDFVARITGGWDLGSLPSNVRVGEGVWIEHVDVFERFRSRRDPGLVLGPGTRVHTWTRFAVDPDGAVVVGADCVLAGPVLMCAQEITIGPRTVLSYHVTVADSDFHPVDPAERRIDARANAPDGDRSRRPPHPSAPVRIGADVRVGIGAIILKGVAIGDGATIGAGAVVARDVPPQGHVAGNPARPVGP